MQKIKAVIFDLDGTIADTLPLCIRAFRQSIEPLIRRSLSDAEIIATFGPSEEGTIMALAPDHYDKGLSTYLELYKTMHTMCSRPFGGMRELLGLLKNNGVRISMVTGKGRKSTEISLTQFELTDYFEVLETGSPEGPRKAEGIQAVLNGLEGIKKTEVLYVGDAPSDIIASRKAGVKVIAAAWAKMAEAEKLRDLNPDKIFHSVQGFTNWIATQI